jgi:hypothetical protein
MNKDELEPPKPPKPEPEPYKKKAMEIIKQSHKQQLAIEAKNNKNNTIIYPDEDYEYMNRGRYVYIKGWSGTMVTNKLGMSNGKMYGFINSIVMPDVSIWQKLYNGVHDNFLFTCPYMFHGAYLDDRVDMHSTCFGNYHPVVPKTFKELQEICSTHLSKLFETVSVETIHDDEIWPKDSPHEDVCKFIKKNYRSINSNTPDLDKYFVEIL